MRHRILLTAPLALAAATLAAAQSGARPVAPAAPAGALALPGGTPVWHPVTVDFAGPASDERADAPNPFLDYRLDVTFTAPSGSQLRVPGFYAGDGRGGSTGSVWRCRLNPDEHGTWSYRASFRAGTDIAVTLAPADGVPVSFDGATGTFDVLPRDLAAPGFLRHGRLEYVGEHYLKARDGDWFVKTGTNSPENFMAYRGFDDVQDAGGIGLIHEYAPHRSDWQLGDPLFVSASTGVDSKGIIGALNYLGSQGVNSIYFLPMNLGGDGQDTCPFVGYARTPFDKTHYDVSRLRQWNTVLHHAQQQGILVHFVLAETEAANENWLDDGAMGLERKLFFRELSARFGYLNGVKWNLSEENDYPVTVLRQMASYLDAVDPYDHIIAVHTHPNGIDQYTPLYRDLRFDAASVQYFRQSAGGLTHAVRALSRQGQRRWIVDMDENGTPSEGLSQSNAAQLRKEVLYDVLLSNGNIEWYCGYHSLPEGGDVRLEDFRTREDMWRYSRIAREFLQAHFDLPEAVPGDHLVIATSAYGGAEVLLERNRRMAIYLPDASTAPVVDLTHHEGTYAVSWISPRTGLVVAYGPDATRTSGMTTVLPVVVPNEADDWLVLLERTDG